MPIATNPDTGDVVYLEGNEWKPARTAVNPKTREMRAWDGNDWVPVTAHGQGTANVVGSQSVAQSIYGMLPESVQKGLSIAGGVATGGVVGGLKAAGVNVPKAVDAPNVVLQDPNVNVALGVMSPPLAGGVAQATRAAQSTKSAIAEVKAGAKSIYGALEKDDTKLQPGFGENIVGSIKTHRQLSKDTRGILKDLTDNPNATIADAFATHKSLGDIFKSAPSAEHTAASLAQDAIEAEIGKASPGAGERLKQADTEYAKAKLAEILDKKNVQAELRAAGAHSGMGYGNKVQQNLTTFLLSREGKKLENSNPEFYAQVKKVAESNLTLDSIRILGNLLGGGGGLGAVAAGAAGVAELGPGGIALPAVGMGALGLRNRIIAGQARGLVHSALGGRKLAAQRKKSLELLRLGQPALLGGRLDESEQ